MNRDDIIRMAQEAGIVWGDHTTTGSRENLLERFAALVATAEREACAKLLDDMAAQDKWSNYYKVAANAIRARGE